MILSKICLGQKHFLFKRKIHIIVYSDKRCKNAHPWLTEAQVNKKSLRNLNDIYVVLNTIVHSGVKFLTGHSNPSDYVATNIGFLTKVIANIPYRTF